MQLVGVSKMATAGVAFLLIVRVGLALAGQQRQSSAQAQRSRSLEGAWKLVKVRHTPPDGFNLAEWRQIKVLTATHWVFLGAETVVAEVHNITAGSEAQ